MKVTISSIGTRGEVQPILALALELQSLGHSAVLCVAPNFKRWVESFGVECVPLGLDVEQFTRKRAVTKRKPSRAEMRELVPDFVRESFKVLGDTARGCDLIVVCGGVQAAGRSIAESLKLPYVYATYCPVTLPSPQHAPPMIRSQSLPRFLNRLLWRSMGWLGNRVFRDSLNEERAKLGLSPVTDVQRHVSTEHPWVAADAVLAPADSIYGMQVTQTGAWFLADPTELPDELERFLDRWRGSYLFRLRQHGCVAGDGSHAHPGGAHAWPPRTHLARLGQAERHRCKGRLPLDRRRQSRKTLSASCRHRASRRRRNHDGRRTRRQAASGGPFSLRSVLLVAQSAAPRHRRIRSHRPSA